LSYVLPELVLCVSSLKLIVLKILFTSYDNYGHLNLEGMKPSLIILITHSGYGGAHKSYSRIADCLSSQYNVICLAFTSISPFPYSLPSAIRYLDTGIPSIFNFTSLGRFFWRVFRLSWLRIKHKPHFVISLLEGSDYVNFLSFGPGLSISSVRGSFFADQELVRYRKIRLYALSLIYRHFKAVITCSASLKNELVSNFSLPPSSVIPIPNIYYQSDVVNTHQAPELLEHSDVYRRYYCFTHGRLCIPKNQASLIRIFSSLSERFSPITLIISGSGPLLPSFKDLASSLRLGQEDLSAVPDEHLISSVLSSDANLIFTGYRKDVAGLMTISSCYLFPSFYEGYPNSLVEALQAGLPVITADFLHGAREILDVPLDASLTYPYLSQAGYLLPIPASDDTTCHEMWAGKVIHIISNPDLQRRLSQGALNRSKQLILSNNCAKWIQALSSLLSPEGLS